PLRLGRRRYLPPPSGSWHPRGHRGARRQRVTNPLTGRGEPGPTPKRGNGRPHSFTEVAMEVTNRTTTTTTTRGRRTCADILATLSDVDRRALERWRRISDDDSVYLGGRGYVPLGQLDDACRAGGAVSPATREAYYSMVRVTTQNLVDAIRDAGIPKAKNEIEAIQVLLGPDHPALKILPALGLVVAYWDALDQIDS